MQPLPMASSPDGLISARDAVITKTPGWEVLTTGGGGGRVPELRRRPPRGPIPTSHAAAGRREERVLRLAPPSTALQAALTVWFGVSSA